MLTIDRSVTCPWCKSYYSSYPLSPNCVNCGGPLPKAIGADKGEKPEEPPRVLPKKFVHQVMYWRNTHSLIGIVFIAIGIPTTFAMGFGLIFLAVGIFLYRYGRKVGQEKIQALSNGVAVDGTITEIYQDTSQSINGRHPYIIKYQFTTREGAQQADSVTSWDDNSTLRNHGDGIWIVYIPENPTISSPWPPIV
ncbi:MAG: DUF3592 domain-containing protein [Chitinophagales bacterium]